MGGLEIKFMLGHNLYSSEHIRMIKSGRIRWAGHVARMDDIRGANTVLVGGDLMERDHSEDLGVDRGIILPRQAMYVQRNI